MYYPGDIVTFYVSLARADAAVPVVTTAPHISILGSDDAALDIAGLGIKTAAMPAIAGADALYKFPWNTSGAGNGNYIAVISYVVDGLTVTSRLLKEVQLGDSRITTEVASKATAAKTTDLPDKTLVMLKTDFVAPAADASIITILSKVNALPASVASQTSLLQVLSLTQDLHDYESGNWTVDKSVSPNRMSFYRPDGSLLQAFDLINNDTTSARRSQ